LRYVWSGSAGERRVRRRQLAVVTVLSAVVLLVALALGSRGIGEGAAQPAELQGVARADWIPSYSRDVEPIFDRTCIQCHGPERADKGLRLDSYQRMMAGDSYGTVVIPGDSSLSAIVTILKGGTMPHGGTGLSPTELETVSRWIDSGATAN
jgi:mono/diheme cytochrome c family protein